MRAAWRSARVLTRALLVLLAVNMLVLGAYTLPHLVRERSLASRAAVLRQEVDGGRRLVASLRERAETVRANRRDAERFYAEVVGERRGSETAALHEVESLARELGLHPERRTYRHAEVKGLPLVRVEINMPISGSYTQLVSFLDRLERSSAFLTVDRVELRGKEGAEGEADLSVVLSAYFRAEAAEGHAS